MTLRLVVVDPARDGALVAQGAFEGPEVTFGRRVGENDLVIPDPAKRVSSKHGAFVYRDGAWHVRDLGSLNGTLLEGETVPVDEQGLQVSHANIITIGGLEMQVLEVEEGSGIRIPQDSEFEKTRAVVDDGREDRMVVELEALWLQHAGNPAARTAAIQQYLREGIRDMMPDKARSMLLRMAERWGGAPEIQDPELEKRERLFRVAFDGLNDLSRNLAGDQRFQDADQVGRFVMLLRQTLELAAEWIARNLQVRETVGEEFGAEVTQIFKRSRNPLKEARDASDVLSMLLDWQQERPPAAVADSLRDLFEDFSKQQMGLLRGVQAAVEALSDLVSPDKIEADVESAGFSMSSRSSRAWEAFRKIYSERLQERGRLYKEVVSPAIRDGYVRAHESEHPGP